MNASLGPAVQPHAASSPGKCLAQQQTLGSEREIHQSSHGASPQEDLFVYNVQSPPYYTAQTHIDVTLFHQQETHRDI